MRPDVKLGIIASLIIVVVAGGYFLYRDKREAPILLSQGKPSKNTNAEESARHGAARPVDNPASHSRSTGGKVAPHRSTKRNSTPRARRGTPSKLQTSSPVHSNSATENNSPETEPNQPERKTEAAKPAAESSRPRPAPIQVAPQTRPNLVTSTPNSDTGISARHDANQDKGADNPSGASNSEVGAAAVHRSKPGEGQTDTRVVDSASGTPTAIPTTAKLIEDAMHSDRRVAAKTKEPVELHRTQPGDSLASIARDYYGDERYTKLLAENNRQITDPNALKVGTWIKIPPVSSNPSATSVSLSAKTPGAPSTDAARTYTVRSGDSFYAIARDVLGDAARWKELFNLNQSLVGGDPKKLKVGQVITLPQT